MLVVNLGMPLGCAPRPQTSLQDSESPRRQGFEIFGRGLRHESQGYKR